MTNSRLSARVAYKNHSEARDEHERGWLGCLAKLEDLWVG